MDLCGLGFGQSGSGTPLACARLNETRHGLSGWRAMGELWGAGSKAPKEAIPQIPIHSPRGPLASGLGRKMKGDEAVANVARNHHHCRV